MRIISDKDIFSSNTAVWILTEATLFVLKLCLGCPNCMEVRNFFFHQLLELLELHNKKSYHGEQWRAGMRR